MRIEINQSYLLLVINHLSNQKAMMKFEIIFCAALTFSSIFALPFGDDDEETNNCGYDSCHKTDPDKINVHLVPHSHDDVGWLKTVDEYFYGTSNNIQDAGVQYIIGSVVNALRDNPDRRFIQVETAFFWKWWQDQNTATREIFQQLVNNGQLEIVGGAWSMNDEAITNYQSIIDQFTLGLKTIENTLGKCGRPKIGWQIDPFGHTREMASIFANLGYDGVMFTRLDYRDVKNRQSKNTTEFVWRGSPDLGAASDLFTSLIYRFYDAPATFCWDVLCKDLPVIDDKSSPLHNVKSRVEQFEKYILAQKANYRTNNILITMGGDFTYQAASMYYTNIDKLIKGFRELKNDTYNLIYSTPSCYIKAVNEYAKSKSLKYSLKTDDFIPYASDEHSYWSGYYTSRPNSKRFERKANNLLQVMKQLTALTSLDDEDSQNLDLLKEIMGIMQHHDAITGTEKQHVTDDYVRLLTKASKSVEQSDNSTILKLLAKDDQEKVKVEFVSCLLANVTHCDESNSPHFVVAVYNPLSKYVSHYVNLPVTGIEYSVQMLNGTKVDYQVSPSMNAFQHYTDITRSAYELVFKATDLPPLGMRLYYVKKMDKLNNEPNKIKEEAKLKLGTAEIGFTLNDKTKFLETVIVKGKSYSVNQQFLYYNAQNGTNKDPIIRASGAYVFRPVGDSAKPLAPKAEVKVYSGALFDEVHQTFNAWIKQIIRVYKDENHIEFNWLVGPVEYLDEFGVEVISRFKTDLATLTDFYTDSNGRGLIKRVRNARETFTITGEEKVSGNYYPITSRIVLKDTSKGNREFAILTDRAQGGSSLQSGEVELMVHRRLMNDDNFGVNEVLNEQEFGKPVVVKGRHFLIIGTNEESSTVEAQQHDVIQRKLLAPWPFLANVTEEDVSKLNETLHTEFSGIVNPLPENVNILTLEHWSKDFLLLRLEHLFETNEDVNLSQKVEIDLNDLFTLYSITSIQEMTLGANQKKEDNAKLSWALEKEEETGQKDDLEDDYRSLKVVLKPMEIRTFIIGVAVKVTDNSSQIYTLHKLFLLIVSLLIFIR